MNSESAVCAAVSFGNELSNLPLVDSRITRPPVLDKLFTRNIITIIYCSNSGDPVNNSLS